MIEINLLPPEIKKRKRKIELPDVSFLPIVAGLLGVVIMIHLSLGMILALKAKSLKRLERKWETILPDEQVAGRMKSELTAMKSKIDAIDKLMKNRRSWARRLNDISDSMIAGVWLNKLWLENRVITREPVVKSDTGGSGGKVKETKTEPKKIVIRSLHLAGSVIAAGGEETATIGKFIRGIKDNENFFSDFKDIESASIQRTKLKEEEIMNFELIGYFK